MSRRSRSRSRSSSAGILVCVRFFPFLFLFTGLVASLPTAAAAVAVRQDAFAVQSQSGARGCMISEKYDNSFSPSHASSYGQKDGECGTGNTAQLKERESTLQSPSSSGPSSPMRKTKREIGNGDSPEEQEEQEELSSEMSRLREELLGTLLARASGTLDRQVVLRIADDAVRKLMQETSAAAAATPDDAGGRPGQTSPASLVRLPPSMLAQDDSSSSEANLDEALQSKIRDRAYRDRWWNPTATMPYMIEELSAAFPRVGDEMIVMFAGEAAVLVDEERSAFDEVARTAFGLDSFLLYDDEGMAMGSLLRKAVSEVRRNDLSVNELSALLRSQYPPLMNFHRELIARTALYMVEMEERRGRS